MPKIYLLDVTNRDGVQTARISLSKLQKTILNLMLNDFGAYQTEVGFPFLDHEASYINANLELAEMGVLQPIVLEGWCRGVAQDVHDAKRFCPKLQHFNVSISTSDQMIIHKFQGKLDRESVISEMVQAVQAAKEVGAKSIGANAEDASRTEMSYLVRFAAAAKEAGAVRVRYCDTLGYDDPMTVYRRIKELATEVGIDIELHCHNDLGMATANSIAGAKGAVDAGQDAYINTTVNGIGERAGQADLVTTALALKYAAGFKEWNLLDERVDTRQSWRISHYIANAFGVPIPINWPGVGANAFAHESGIHADGTLKDRRNYELYDLEDVGRGSEECETTGRVITTGEYGGLKGMLKVYGDLGIEIKDNEQARELLHLVQYANLHNQMPLTSEELIFLYKYPAQARKILTVTP